MADMLATVGWALSCRVRTTPAISPPPAVAHQTEEGDRLPRYRDPSGREREHTPEQSSKSLEQECVFRGDSPFHGLGKLRWVLEPQAGQRPAKGRSDGPQEATEATCATSPAEPRLSPC